MPRRLTPRHALLLVLATAATSAAAALWLVPFAEPLFFHLDNAREWLETGRITGHHAVGYALVLAAGLAVQGLAGVLALHVLIFLAAAVVASDIMRLLGLGPSARVAAGLVVGLHPLLVANVTKISDTNLSVLLLLLLVHLLVRVRRDGWSNRVTAETAALCGAVLLIRPNLAVLVPVLAFAGARHGRARAVGGWGAAVAAAVLAALAVNAATTGAWRLTHPYYAAYTFHNGNNPRAAEHILRETIGEYSTYRALEEAGIAYAGVSREALTPVLWRHSLGWIRQHPADYVWLLGVKAMNLFRPYYRRGQRGPAAWWAATVVQTLAALPVVLWGVLRWRARGRVRWRDGLMTVLVLPLFALPFVLTNVEPRYRWPMDVVLLLESVWLVAVARMSSDPARFVANCSPIQHVGQS